MRRGEASIEISSVQVVDMVYMSTRNIGRHKAAYVKLARQTATLCSLRWLLPYIHDSA